MTRITLPAAVAAALEEAAIERERNAKYCKEDAAITSPSRAAYYRRCANVDLKIAVELRQFLAQHDVEPVDFPEEELIVFRASLIVGAASGALGGLL